MSVLLIFNARSSKLPDVCRSATITETCETGFPDSIHSPTRHHLPMLWSNLVSAQAIHDTSSYCRPPPKVDSSDVRIEPRRPCVNVNFLEWDGLIRLCFSRKNKTLGAIFRQPSTLALMYSNYQLCQALAASGSGKGGVAGTAPVAAATAAAPASVPLKMDVDLEDDVHMSDEDGEDDVMDVDEDGSKRNVWPSHDIKGTVRTSINLHPTRK